jgi:hypothetical protein
VCKGCGGNGGLLDEEACNGQEEDSSIGMMYLQCLASHPDAGAEFLYFYFTIDLARHPDDATFTTTQLHVSLGVK